MPAFTDIAIKSYSDRSIVVIDKKGKHEDSLLALGGKKNGGLTDKDTGNRFEGYIFATKWLDKVKAWQSAGRELKYNKPEGGEPDNYTSEYSSSSAGGGQQSRQLLLELEKTQAEVKWLRSVVMQMAKIAGLEIEEEEEAPPAKAPPPRRPRLLGD